MENIFTKFRNLKIQFVHSHVEYLPKISEPLSEEKVERIHRDMKERQNECILLLDAEQRLDACCLQE